MRKGASKRKRKGLVESDGRAYHQRSLKNMKIRFGSINRSLDTFEIFHDAVDTADGDEQRGGVEDPDYCCEAAPIRQ